MKKNQTDIVSLVSDHRVKLHRFEPSKREIWTVVGKKNEHWLDPELGFCSCQSYFFDNLENGRECYHLKSIKVAKDLHKIELILFADEEFEHFVFALVSDI